MTALTFLRAGSNRVAISSMGAELQTWLLDGQELLWCGDAQWWPERSPILFPVVGWTRGGEARVNGRVFPLGLHGFARRMTFEVEQSSETHATFLLRDSPESLAQYPFRFTLAATYTIDEVSITVSLTVRNADAQPMPYAIGLHPGFMVSKAAAQLAFESVEDPLIPVIAPGGLFSTVRRTAPLRGGRMLPLNDATFAHEALCFLDVRSTSLELSPGDGPRLRLTWRNFPNVVVWSRPGAPFACVEVWTGTGDPEHFAGELAQKPGMISLDPGALREHSLTIAALP